MASTPVLVPYGCARGRCGRTGHLSIHTRVLAPSRAMHTHTHTTLVTHTATPTASVRVLWTCAREGNGIRILILYFLISRVGAVGRRGAARHCQSDQHRAYGARSAAATGSVCVSSPPRSPSRPSAEGPRRLGSYYFPRGAGGIRAAWRVPCTSSIPRAGTVPGWRARAPSALCTPPTCTLPFVCAVRTTRRAQTTASGPHHALIT